MARLSSAQWKRQKCFDCPYNLICTMDRLFAHWAVHHICPQCGLVRHGNAANVESDEDYAEPHVFCNKLQGRAKKYLGAWVRMAVDPRNLDWKNTSIEISLPLSYGRVSVRFLLCDDCRRTFTPNKGVSLYEIFADGGPP